MNLLETERYINFNIMIIIIIIIYTLRVKAIFVFANSKFSPADGYLIIGLNYIFRYMLLRNTLSFDFRLRHSNSEKAGPRMPNIICVVRLITT